MVQSTLTITVQATDAAPIVATRAYRDGTYLFVRRSGAAAVRWNEDEGDGDRHDERGPDGRAQAVPHRAPGSGRRLA